MKKLKDLGPVFTLILGLVLLIVPGEILKTVIRIVGILILIVGGIGIYDDYKANNKIEATYNIMMAILGLILFSSPTIIAGIIPFIIGGWLSVKAIFNLQLVNTTLKKGTNEYLTQLITNIVILIIGVVLLFNPFKGAVLSLRIIGIILIVYSILEFVNYKSNKPKKVKVIK